ncbi:MAG: minichromosome maintenance protein MCM [Candidatus Helarchaeota archaeon]
MDFDDPVDMIENFLNNFVNKDNEYYYREKIKSMPYEDKTFLLINFEDFFKFNPSLARELIENPNKILLAANQAIKKVLEKVDKDFYDLNPECIARFSNLISDYHVDLRAIRKDHIGKFVQIHGILSRASEVKAQVINAAFECQHCQTINLIEVDPYNFKPPVICSENSCGKRGPFKFIPESSIFIDWQKIRIQEVPEELPAGQLPRSLDAILKKDLVDAARPGDRVSITGTIYPMQDARMGKKLSTFHAILDANHVEVFQKEFDKIELSKEDEERIEEFGKDEFIHEKIVKSIAPSIFGYNEYKKAIALFLFSGRNKELADGMKIRGQTHILLVGDPGVGKSKLLQYAKMLAPRGLYTSGKGSTAAGLTATVIRDKDTGEWTLEAGALVIADRGVACIDEFDKMNEFDRSAIHEAMEEQTVHITKAGINASLNARTSILAAANPTFGKYDPFKPVGDNIKKLSPSILSRFDLIFVLKDEPSPKKDEGLTDHILGLQDQDLTTLEPPIEMDLLRKYISYAQTNIHPVLTEEAKQIIKEYYLNLRNISETPDSPIAITPRQLQGLIRLTEAHARMGLREEVTKEDAEAAVEIMKLSLSQVGIDKETGKPDILVLTAGTSQSQISRLQKLEDIIRRLFLENNKEPVNRKKIVEEAEREGLAHDFIEKAIKELIDKSMIYQPQKDHFAPI